MGYTTNFTGQLKFSTPLTKEQVSYIQAFNQTRRMKRNSDLAEQMPDPKRKAAKLPIGRDAQFFVGNETDMGQVMDSSVVEYNSPPFGQPGLWCNWTVSNDGTALLWDESEKFYDYVEWLQYMIDHFFSPWNTKLNGTIDWEGEDHSDTGTIKVVDSVISIDNGVVTSEEKLKDTISWAFEAGFYAYSEVDRNYDPSEQEDGLREALEEYLKDL